MRSALTTLGGFIDWIERICAAIAALLIVYIMVTISADVVGRYFLNSPIGWAIEFAEYALLAIPFLSMAWLVRVNGHVRIDLLLSQLSERTLRIMTLLTNTLAFGTCAVASLYAVRTTISQFERNVMTIGIYPVEKYLLIALIAFGLILTTIEFARAIVRTWQGDE